MSDIGAYHLQHHHLRTISADFVLFSQTAPRWGTARVSPQRDDTPVHEDALLRLQVDACGTEVGAGVERDAVQLATLADMLGSYNLSTCDAAKIIVLEILADPRATPYARFWRVGSTFYRDDAYEGPVVAIEDLTYNEELGLCTRAELEE